MLLDAVFCLYEDIMPRIVPQELKAESTINAQPKQDSSVIMNIMLLDLAGRDNNDIAQIVGLTPPRVSTIRNSPLYTQRYDEERAKLIERFVDKKADKLVTGDPVDNLIRDHCLDAAQR